MSTIWVALIALVAMMLTLFGGKLILHKSFSI